MVRARRAGADSTHVRQAQATQPWPFSQARDSGPHFNQQNHTGIKKADHIMCRLSYNYLILLRILGGKCKFRTYDHCNVNASDGTTAQRSHRENFVMAVTSRHEIAPDYTGIYTGPTEHRLARMPYDFS